MEKNSGRGIGRKVWRAVYPIIVQVLIVGLVADAMLLWGKNSQRLSQDPFLLSNLSALIAAVLSLCISITLYKRDISPRSGQDIRNARIRWWEPALMLLMGIGASQYLNMLINMVRLKDMFPYSGYSSQAAPLGEFWLSVFCVGIAAPIAEEMIFRGLVFGRLKEFMKPGWAILVSSLLFGIYHGNVVQFVYASLLGILLCWMAEGTHSLAAPVFIHGAANIWALFLDRWGSSLLQTADGHVFQGILVLQAVFLLLGLYNFMKKRDNSNPMG